jgi:hypothetical protein
MFPYLGLVARAFNEEGCGIGQRGVQVERQEDYYETYSTIGFTPSAQRLKPNAVSFVVRATHYQQRP